MTAKEKIEWLQTQRLGGRFKCAHPSEDVGIRIMLSHWLDRLSNRRDKQETIDQIEVLKSMRSIGRFRCEVDWEDDDMSTMLNQIIIEIKYQD